ncbi:MAG: hypothetical protein KGY57_03565, partial [Gammaproteobacteria bacterium]|nr:hypothetical protein [Gammaproteobacteria bacterium]
MASDSVTLRYFRPLVWVVLLMVTAPLVGVWLAGGNPDVFVRFPPRPLAAAPGSFTPSIFLIYLVAIVAVLGPFIVTISVTALKSAGQRGA